MVEEPNISKSNFENSQNKYFFNWKNWRKKIMKTHSYICIWCIFLSHHIPSTWKYKYSDWVTRLQYCSYCSFITTITLCDGKKNNAILFCNYQLQLPITNNISLAIFQLKTFLSKVCLPDNLIADKFLC